MSEPMPDFRLRRAENGWLLMEDAFDAGVQSRIWLVEAVAQTGKGGTVTLKLAVKPASPPGRGRRAGRFRRGPPCPTA